MKCRACWTDKAYVRDVNGWRGVLNNWLGIVPLKCHHCYHKFSVPWFATIGKRLTPPVLTIRPVGTFAEKHLVESGPHADSAGKALRPAA